MVKYIVPFLILLSWATPAEVTEILSIDRSVSRSINLFFPNDNNIKPKEGGL